MLIIALFLILLSSCFLAIGVMHLYKQQTTRIKECASSYHPSRRRQGHIEPRTFPKNQLSQAEKDLFLRLHNQSRLQNGADPLSWDERLADSAQAYADLLWREDCAIHHPETPADDKKYLQDGLDGQNLSQFVYDGAHQPVGSIQKAVRLWTDECYQFDPTRPTENGVGHFTQLIWKDTKQLGCAYRELTRSDKTASIYVCHYHKSGNWLTSTGGLDRFRQNVQDAPVCTA